MWSAISTILRADSAVTALVSDRVFVRRIPQEVETYPQLMYYVSSGDPETTKEGPTTLDTYRITFDIFAGSYEAAWDVSKAVRDAIDRYTIGTTVAGIIMDGVSKENAEDDVDDIEVNGQPLVVMRDDYFMRIKQP